MIKIESKEFKPTKNANTEDGCAEIVNAFKALKPGQSFVSNNAKLVSTVMYFAIRFLDGEFKSLAEDGKRRVYRVK